VVVRVRACWAWWWNRHVHDFPYLCDGNVDYEQKGTETYVGVPDSVIVLAIHDERVIGASTGLLR
jgi:hypothetical protein